MGSIQTDQRRFTRRPASVKAMLCFDDQDVPTRVETVDLGEEGVQCLSRVSLPSGTRVLVRMQLQSDGPWIECKGKICWLRVDDDQKSRFGVRFLDLREDEREMLGLFLMDC